MLQGKGLSLNHEVNKIIYSINKSYVARHGLTFELFSILAHR